jgi:hypothetical protein
MRDRFIKLWILGAAVVLAIDRIWVYRHNTSETTDVRYRGEDDPLPTLHVARDIFRSIDPFDRGPHVTRGCAHTIDVLLTIGEDRIGRPASTTDISKEIKEYLDEVTASLRTQSRYLLVIYGPTS